MLFKESWLPLVHWCSSCPGSSSASFKHKKNSPLRVRYAHTGILRFLFCFTWRFAPGSLWVRFKKASCKELSQSHNPPHSPLPSAFSAATQEGGRQGKCDNSCGKSEQDTLQCQWQQQGKHKARKGMKAQRTNQRGQLLGVFTRAMFLDTPGLPGCSWIKKRNKLFQFQH